MTPTSGHASSMSHETKLLVPIFHQYISNDGHDIGSSYLMIRRNCRRWSTLPPFTAFLYHPKWYIVLTRISNMDEPPSSNEENRMMLKCILYRNINYSISIRPHDLTGQKIHIQTRKKCHYKPDKMLLTWIERWQVTHSVNPPHPRRRIRSIIALVHCNRSHMKLAIHVILISPPSTPLLTLGTSSSFLHIFCHIFLSPKAHFLQILLSYYKAPVCWYLVTIPICASARITSLLVASRTLKCSDSMATNKEQQKRQSSTFALGAGGEGSVIPVHS